MIKIIKHGREWDEKQTKECGCGCMFSFGMGDTFGVKYTSNTTLNAVKCPECGRILLLCQNE